MNHLLISLFEMYRTIITSDNQFEYEDFRQVNRLIFLTQ